MDVSKYKLKILIIILVFIGLFLAQVVKAEIQTINFSGYNWQVKSGYFYPGPNYWNNNQDAVFVDEEGKLHLIIYKISNKWKSAEIYLDKSLGYGTYEFIIESNIAKIDKNLIGATFLYADYGREFDIEFTRWGVEGYENIEYSVHSTTNEIASIKNYLLPSIDDETIHKIEWTPDYVKFSSHYGNNVLAEWKYIGKDNFIPGDERVHINFWQLNGMAPSSNKIEEIIFKSFSFTPYKYDFQDNVILSKIVKPKDMNNNIYKIEPKCKLRCKLKKLNSKI